MEGWPIGRIVGSRVYRFDGAYVGECFKDMVVSRSETGGRALTPIPVPRRQPPPDGYRRRVVIDYGYADAFHLLRREEEPASDGAAGHLEPWAAEEPVETEETIAPAPKKPADPGTVLVVDDESPVREMIGHALRDLGFEVQEARSGREAVAMLERRARSSWSWISRCPTWTVPKWSAR